MTFANGVAVSRPSPRRTTGALRRLQISAVIVLLAAFCRYPSAHAAGQEVNQPVPDLTFRTYQDETIRTGDLKGDVVFVYLWAADCKACVAAREAIERLDKQFAVQGVWFLAVDEDDKPQSWKDYLFHNLSPMTEVRDENHSFRKKVRLPKLPAAFVVDRAGQIRWSSPHWADTDEAKASAQMSTLLQEAKPK